MPGLRHRRAGRVAAIVFAAVFILFGAARAAPPVADAAGDLLAGDAGVRAGAIRALGDSGAQGAIAPLIQWLYWAPEKEQREVVAALAALTGKRFESWFDWQVWEQEATGLDPFAGYDAWLARVLGRIDPAFGRFVSAGIAHRIRLEEIVWGGVRVDGIPALDRPATASAAQAAYLADDDLVFGIEIAGVTRAYPLRIVDWHEMVNDVVAGVPVSVAYCTLCGAAIAFDTRPNGGTAGRTFHFGSSGLLYRSNKLMYDRETDSLWNQFTGEPVLGALASSGVRLPIYPIVTTSWLSWRRLHPDTTVLAESTGFNRDYRPGAAYGAYFASSRLMFPAAVGDPAHQKEFAFGIRVPGGTKAWPLERFAGGRVINDQVGLLNVVLVGDAADRTVRAYDAQDHRFEATAQPDRLHAADGVWQVTEQALVGPSGKSLRRLPGHVAYRFAWDGYFGAGVEAP